MMLKTSSLRLEPNDCLLSDPFSLTLGFGVTEPGAQKLSKVKWQVKWVIDVADANVDVDLLETEAFDYDEGGDHSVTLKVTLEQVLAKFSRSLLLNLSALTILAINEETNTELLRLSVLTQVTRDGDSLKRLFIDPYVH